MEFRKINIWYVSSLLISLVVAAPILTVFSSFFETTGNYSLILKNTFLYAYIYNSLILLIGFLFLTFIAEPNFINNSIISGSPFFPTAKYKGVNP